MTKLFGTSTSGPHDHVCVVTTTRHQGLIDGKGSLLPDDYHWILTGKGAHCPTVDTIEYYEIIM